MSKLRYTIGFETGNDFEPIDYYDEWVDIEDDMTPEEIETFLQEEREMLKTYTDQTGRDVWIGSWEVCE